MAMKSLELAPTKENIINTLHKDSIDRNESVGRFVKFCDAQESHCSIAIDAKWGFGKTFFVKQVKMVLEAYNPHSQNLNEDDKESIKDIQIIKDILQPSQNEEAGIQSSVCVYYDAWANDNDVDSMLSLVYQILRSSGQEYELTRNIDIPKGFIRVLEIITGKNVGSLIEILKGDDILAFFKEQKEVEQAIEEFLASLLPERGERLVIFIDELDRCKPSFAVQLLERIKHYFTNDRITFVFSINFGELQHTIKQYYGSDFDACRYLDRFFDYRIALPPANFSKYYQSIGFGESHYVFDAVRKLFIRKYGLGLREIEKYYRMTNIAVQKLAYDSRYSSGLYGENGMRFGLIAIIPIIIGLQIVDYKRYVEFVSGKNSGPLIEILREEDSICSVLLDDSEVFDERLAGSNKKAVSIEDRLEEAYNALFNEQNRRDWDEIRIGKCSFRTEVKNKILKVSSMLSGVTSYDI